MLTKPYKKSRLQCHYGTYTYIVHTKWFDVKFDLTADQLHMCESIFSLLVCFGIRAFMFVLFSFLIVRGTAMRDERSSVKYKIWVQRAVVITDKRKTQKKNMKMQNRFVNWIVVWTRSHTGNTNARIESVYLHKQV